MLQRVFSLFSEQRRAERVCGAGRTWQGWQEEAHTTHLQWAADLRAGEDLWTDQVPGRTRAREASIRARHDWVTG